MSHDPHHSERATYRRWLADPVNARADGRERIQAALDRLPPAPQAEGQPAQSAGQTDGARDAAMQIIATVGLVPSCDAAEPRTEAELAAQILASANLKRVSPA